jgi:hypothetical protein
MATPWQFFVSALYVTFTYASIGFGALYYRSVVDGMRAREARPGEELFAFVDPRTYFGVGCLAFFFCIFVVLLLVQTDLFHEEVNRSAPGLVFLVIPMVLLVNIAQLVLRARGQQTLVCTQGVMIRRMLTEKMYIVHFDDVVRAARIEREFWWFKIVFADVSGEDMKPCYVGPSALPRVVKFLSISQGYKIASDDISLSEDTCE